VLSLLFQISPLSLFTHSCDCTFTYVWIFLFNASSLTALIIVALCIFAVHQTAFEARSILFLALTLCAFVSIAVFPIIAVISFFKLSVFAFSALAQSNVNVIPAVYAQNALCPLLDSLNNKRSNAFYEALFHFIHRKPRNWRVRATAVVRSILIALSLPIFAFFASAHSNLNSKPKDIESDSEIEIESSASENSKASTKKTTANSNSKICAMDEYELRISIANRVLAKHYIGHLWIPPHSKFVARILLETPISESTSRFTRALRGYTVRSALSAVRSTLLWRNRSDLATDFARLTFYDKVLEAQYLLALFVFVPLQSIFALYGLAYPYLIAYRLCADLYFAQSSSNPILFAMAEMRALGFRDPLTNPFFVLFALCAAAHSMVTLRLARKLWHLRELFELCFDVFIVPDNAVLSRELVREMTDRRTTIESTKVRDAELRRLLGRYSLDKLVIEFTGDMNVRTTH